jgi:outer membrane receptor protein involved in Fe transport
MLQNDSGNPRLRLAVRLALTGSSLAATCGVANAQQAPAPAAAPSDTTLTEVVVTGSRIAVPNETSISPVTFVSSVEIQERGTTRIEDLLNQLPQVFADQGSMLSNGAEGTATVNLRGLNTKRTLVLVDGDRIAPGDPRSGSTGGADINIIPPALVDSIEVLTGGASAIYGADAVAGVVNFKINDHFEGVKLIANGGIYQHGNGNASNVISDLEDFNKTTGNDFAEAPSNVWQGANKELTFIAGLNSGDGNGNATFYASYRNVNAVLQSKYSYSACTFGSGFLPPTGNGQLGCSGSSYTAGGRFIKLLSNTTVSDTTVGPHGSLVPFTDADRFNYGPLNYYQRPDEEYTGGSFMHYEFNEHATVYASTMFMDDRTIAQIAPSGTFGGPFSANCANPYLSAAELAAWCGGSTNGTTFTAVPPGGVSNNLYILRRNVEGGDRQDDLEHIDWRLTTGVKGKIDDAWSYDASYQYQANTLADTYYNDVSIAKINYALDVIPGPNGPECAITATGVTTGLGRGCVPYNIFTPGGVTPAAAAYISTPGDIRGKITQQIVNANLTGDLGKYGIQSPWAASGLKVNAGGEYRDTKSFSTPDEEFQSGDLAGQGGPQPAVAGGIVVREGFAEARMPVVENQFLANALDVDGAYRYSSYSLGFNTNTYTFAVDWSPVSDVRLRGSFARAVRAPNIVELFAPDTVALDGNTDPCAGPAVGGLVNGYSAAQCARTGVSAAQFGHILANPAAQYNGLTGGVTTLKPETAITKSFGIGFTPSFIPNFRAQIDYYDINIENVIETVGADLELKECLTADLYCDNIHRDGIGSLWINNQGFVTDLLGNVGNLHERGVDVDVSYAYDMGAFGKLRSNVTGTYLDLYEVTPVSSLPTTQYNCAGLYGTTCSSVSSGAGTPVYHWRHVFRTTWSTPWSGLDVSLAWRYYSRVNLEQLSANPNLAGSGTVASGGISNTDSHIPSYNYFDLTAAVKLVDKVTLRLGVNNILDKDPPVIGTTNLPSTSGNGNTFPQVYDALGRFIFGEVTVQF